MSLTAMIYDLASNALADISGISLERTWNRRLNIGSGFTIKAPAGSALLTAIAGDTYPKLRPGNRKLIVWENGGPGDPPLFHGRIFGCERNGDGTQNLVTITAFDPRLELGYEADDRAGRVVRGSSAQPTAGAPYAHYDGNFIDPKFASSVAAQAGISGPDLIKQVLTNSLNTGAESDPSPGEGPLPIDLTTGTFDLTVPPAVDLSVEEVMSWPVMIGDFIALLVQTNVVDVDLRPVDPGEAIAIADPYLMGVLSAVSSQGTDRSATVHFDYFTGSKNAAQCRHVDDWSTACNKLYDYLGPRKTKERWAGNITPGSPGVTVDPTASRNLYGGPHTNKGEMMTIREADTLGFENTVRRLQLGLFNAELGLRVEPRKMLFITPADGAKALYQPPTDFDVGDLVKVNTGADFGLTLAETQRVYGYDVSWTREDVRQVSTLITSADAE